MGHSASSETVAQQPDHHNTGEFEATGSILGYIIFTDSGLGNSPSGVLLIKQTNTRRYLERHYEQVFSEQGETEGQQAQTGAEKCIQMECGDCEMHKPSISLR